jgi:cytochrome b561
MENPMPWKSTTTHYGRVAILLHWLSALLLIGLFVAGLAAANTADPALQAAILRVHAPIGTLVLVLTLLRILWWVAFDRKPDHVAGQAAWQTAVSVWVHRGLYLGIVVMALSGIALMAMSGAPDILFGGVAGPLPAFETFTAYTIHSSMALLLEVLFVLHVAAALYHQFIRRDRLLARMGIGR